MRRRRFEDDFMDDMRHMHRHRHMGIFSLIPMTIGLAMTFVNIGLRIVQTVTDVVFGILFGVTRQVRNNTRDWSHDPHNIPRPEPPRQHRQEAKAEPNPRVNNINEEKVKQQAKAQPQEEKSTHSANKNWSILIFLFSVIISITVLCTGRLLEAAAIFAGGFVLMGIVSLIGSISNRKPKAKPVKTKPCEDEEVEKLLKAAEAKIANIRKSKSNIVKGDMQQKIEDLCKSADNIIKTVRAHPDDLQLVRKFFYYYLDSLGEVTQKYIKISTSGVYDNEIIEVIAETEKAYDDFREIFVDYEKKLLEKDLLNLKAEINVIKNES